MRKAYTLLVLVLLAALTGFGFSDYYWHPYKPIFMHRADLEANVQLRDARDIEQAGKIYLKDHFIFINE